MSGRVHVRLQRWRKSGHDRLYVNGSDGHRWGYVDLKTGSPELAGELGWPEEIGFAIGEWLRLQGDDDGERRRFLTYAARWPTTFAAPPPTTDEETRSTTSSAARKPPRRRDRAADDDDLSANKPGAAVLAEAKRRTTVWTRLGRLLGMRTQDTRWRVGARGERLVGRTLRVARLLGWKSLHAVPLGRGDIDHVLIGPAGVITVNTKHYRGATVRVGRQKVMVRGKSEPWAEKARGEARAASDRLSRVTGRQVDVQPMVVVVAGVHVGLRRRTLGVRVASRRWLLPTLLFRRPRLDRATRDAVYEAARRRSTWQ